MPACHPPAALLLRQSCLATPPVLPTPQTAHACRHAEHHPQYALCPRALPAARLVRRVAAHPAGAAGAGPRLGGCRHRGRRSGGGVCRGRWQERGGPGPHLLAALGCWPSEADTKYGVLTQRLPHFLPMQPGTLDLVLLKRKGFVRIALEAGAALVPVICFGENEQVSGKGACTTGSGIAGCGCAHFWHGLAAPNRPAARTAPHNRSTVASLWLRAASLTGCRR